MGGSGSEYLCSSLQSVMRPGPKSCTTTLPLPDTAITADTASVALLLLLLLPQCYKLIYGYMAFAMLNVFFFLTGALVMQLLRLAGIHMDMFSLMFILLNFSVRPRPLLVLTTLHTCGAAALIHVWPVTSAPWCLLSAALRLGPCCVAVDHVV